MIPKTIHFCWFSGDPYPDSIQRCLDSWSQMLPDYEIVLWNTSNFDVRQNRWVAEAFEKRKWAFVADYFRFWVLYNYGGIYLDSDVEVQDSFDRFLHHQSFFGYEYGSTPEAAVIGAEKGTPWLKLFLDYYADRPFVKPGGGIDGTPLPRHMMAVFRQQYGLNLWDCGHVKQYDDLGLTIYPYQYFSPKNFYYRGRIEQHHDTVTIHHFSNSWAESNDEPSSYRHHRRVISIVGKRVHDYIIHLLRAMK